MKRVQLIISSSVLTTLMLAPLSTNAASYAASATEVTVSASTTKEQMENQKSLDATLLSTSFKSHGRNRIYSIDISAECDIRRFTIGTGMDKSNNSELVADARIWAEIDGQIIPIASDESPDKMGMITLCRQLEWDEASRGNRDDIKTATGFTWVATNLPKGKHQLEIKSNLWAYAKSGVEAGNAVALTVGKRIVKVQALQ